MCFITDKPRNFNARVSHRPVGDGDMDDLKAAMVELSKRHGKEGMRAIATLMHDLGSDAIITFADGTWLPCDALMQLAWAHGGEPAA